MLKHSWKSAWKSSSRPRKQRLFQTKALLHQVSLQSHLSKELRAQLIDKSTNNALLTLFTKAGEKDPENYTLASNLAYLLGDIEYSKTLAQQTTTGAHINGDGLPKLFLLKREQADKKITSNPEEATATYEILGHYDLALTLAQQHNLQYAQPRLEKLVAFEKELHFV